MKVLTEEWSEKWSDIAAILKVCMKKYVWGICSVEQTKLYSLNAVI